VLLPRYAAGELDMAVAEMVRAHLATGCIACLDALFAHPVAARAVAIVEKLAPPVAPGTSSRAAFVAIAAVLLAAVIALHAHFSATPDPPAIVTVSPTAPTIAERPDDVVALPPTTSVHEEARPVVHPPPTVPDTVVRYSGDTLSVRAADVPLTRILDAIGEESGATIEGRIADDRAVTIEFEDVPVAEALDRILGDQNFVLVYDHEHRLRLVELIDGAIEGRPVEVTASPPPAPADVLARHPRLHVNGILAERLGSDTMSLHDLIETALRQEDRDVRGDAMRTAVEVLEADPEFRRALHMTADATPLDDVVRDVGAARAEETLFYVATKASDSELRNRAVTLLDRMHARSGALN